MDLAARAVSPWRRDDGGAVRFRDRLREGLIMIVLTSVVVLFLFVYLLAALLRPEWF